MTKKPCKFRQSAVNLAAFIVMTGCSDQPQTAANNAATNSAVRGDSAATPDLPDACAFFARDELEKAVGWELRQGEAKDVSAGSSCEFEAQTAAYATRTYPNPALPPAAGFSGATITVYPARADSFAQGKVMPGATAKPGLGDDAYFNGPNFLHVRVGDRAFSVRLYVNEPGPAGRPKLEALMQQLGTSGAARLR